MINRLLLFRQLSLLLLCCLPWTCFLSAQSDCHNWNGKFWTFEYEGPDTLLVGNNCMAELDWGSTTTPTLTSGPPPSAFFMSPILTGYNMGDSISAGTVVTVYYIAQAGVGKDTFCFDIAFVDKTAPKPNYTPANATVACGSANFTAWWQNHIDSLNTKATDNCGLDTIYHSAPDSITDNCGVFVDTFFLKDIYGNSTFIVATYTIQDNVPPTLTGVPADTLILCKETVPPPATVTATDNCAAFATPILTIDTTMTGAGACAPYHFTINRTWKANDGCGNMVQATQKIQVRDTISPTFDLPPDTTVNCNAVFDTVATGNISNIADNCSPTNLLTISFEQDTVPGTCPQKMTIHRTWKVTDVCGNVLSKTQTISVQDTVPPITTFPADITVDCKQVTDLAVTGQPTMSSDNCDVSLSASQIANINIAGLCPNAYTIRRVWEVKDDCNNAVIDTQIITVTDLVAPVVTEAAQDLTLLCDDAVNFDSIFHVWVDSLGFAAATDNCTPTNSLTWQAFNQGTNVPATLALPDCLNPVFGAYRRSTVQFIVTDQCGNRDTTVAVFTVADNTPPSVSNCPGSLTMATDPGSCDRTEVLPLPLVWDNCGNTTLSDNVSLTLPFIIPPGSNPIETPIDDLVFELSVPGPPYLAVGNVTLTFKLNSADGEAPTEYLNIYGEDGGLLGKTNPTPAQCANSTTTFTLTANQFNLWSLDGKVVITAKPNIPPALPGRFAVNNICPNNSATAQLTYQTNFPTNLRFEYSVNGGTREPVAPVASFNAVLNQGISDIRYYFTDCAGNVDSTCVFSVKINDEEKPAIICPPNNVFSLDPGVCDVKMEIPLFSNTLDNCAVALPTIQTQPADDGERLLTFSYNPNLNDFVADDKVFIFSGLQGNATPGNVQLIITLQGDVDSPNEYYEIYDQSGNLLGTTAPGQPHVVAGDCHTPSIVTFDIDAKTFNTWAANGDIKITAVSFMDFSIPPAGPGWGINACDTSLVKNDGDTDGSFIYATFQYQSVSPVFSASGATSINPITLTPPLEPMPYTLNRGLTTFTYKIKDLAGNEGECSFDVQVVDNQPPAALCHPTFVDINPSGFVIDTIYPDEIDLGSFDNCGIDSMWVFPNTITCNNAGNILPVMLFAKDEEGNVSICQTFVNVSAESPAPSAMSNCGTNSMQLFANPPPAPGGPNIFKYTWYNPAGIPFAFTQNPIILDADDNNAGFYVVEIEGVTGCEAVGTVQVTCDILPLKKPVLQAADLAVCTDQNIELITPPVCGTSVKYKWYTGVAPGGVYMSTTTTPTYTMTPPASGMFNFYVVVERNGCDSEPSNTLSVQVNMAPVAMPAQSSFIACKGEQIILTSINNAPGTTCHWTGPCGFESFNCSPAPLNDVSPCNSGIYQLVVTNDGCVSQPAYVTVNVLDIPNQPSITNSTSAVNPACEGSTITLSATPSVSAISYQWTSPTFSQISTPTNVLTISNADIAKDAGQWTVKIIGNPCESQVSAPTTVHIVAKPQNVSAAANPAIACEGKNIQLSASSATQNVSYLWTYPNGQTNALQNPVLDNITNADKGIYTLTVTNQFGCSVQKAVNVVVLDRVKITGASSDVPNCVSGPVNINLVATVFPVDNGTYQYLWTGPGGYSSTSANAVIPNATINNSGPYTLLVTNADGCTSLPYTVNVPVPPVLPTPGTPQLSVNNPFCEGESVTLTTTPYTGGSVQYQWTTPTGVMTTNNPSLTLQGLTVSDNGAYFVQYLVSGCLSGTSGSNTLVVNAKPTINPTANTPLCAGEVLGLEVECTAGALYEWTGPAGFSSSVCNPIIPNVSPALHSGTYSVRKRVGGCWSDVIPVNVVVKPKPQVPTAVNDGPYCASTENVIVSVTSNSATPGAMYTWYNSSGVSLGNPTPSLNFALPNPTQYGNGSFNFYVVASVDGCASLPSVPTVVSLNTIPGNVAEAGPDIEACQNDILTLKATPPSIGTGLWTLVSGNPNGVSIANPDQATTTVSGLTPGENYVFQWTLSNGACKSYSFDQTNVFVDILEEADAGNTINACQVTFVSLNAVQPTSNVGFWTQPPAQSQLGVVIAEPNNPKTLITGLVPGNSYIFTWTIDGGCGLSSDVVLVNVSNEVAFAGANFKSCGNGCAQLNATPTLSGSGVWTSPDPSLQIISPNNPKSLVCNLKPGSNTLIWTINNGACGNLSVDEVIIDYRELALAPDEANVNFAGKTTLDAIANDDISGFFTISIVQQPLNGKASITFDGKITYAANLNFIGDDVLFYQVCIENCDCATASVTFHVGENAGCVAPSIITPNRDGVNDAFVVPCLAGDRFVKNRLSIFNQWGDEVFHASPYDNDWEGTYDGEDLPAGTYFYILDLGTGDKPMSGYLIIQR